jgi:hypothetical protein
MKEAQNEAGGFDLCGYFYRSFEQKCSLFFLKNIGSPSPLPEKDCQ